MREELVVGLILVVAALVLERVVELVRSFVGTRKEREEWIAFLDEWLSGGIETCKEIRTVLNRFLKPWREFARVVTAGKGLANAAEFPMIRLERPDIEQVVTSKYPLLRPSLDPLLVLRINGKMRLIRRSLDAVIHLGIEVAMKRDTMRTEPAVAQTVVGEMENAATEASKVLDVARKLPRDQFPQTAKALEAPDELWTRIPPLVPGPHECRRAGTKAPPTRVDVLAQMEETPHGTMRLLRMTDGRAPEEAFPDHEWREVDAHEGDGS